MNKKVAIAFFAVVFVGLVGLFVLRLYLNTPVATPPSLQAPSEKEERTAKTANVYFTKQDSNDCSKVYPVKRTVLSDPPHGMLLRELFRGPTEEEKNQGYSSVFSDKTSDALISLKVEEGVGYVNLKDIRAVVPSVSASCGSAQFFAEVETTLKQDGDIKKVIYALEGEPATFYEWVQIGCTTDNGNCDKTPFQ